MTPLMTMLLMGGGDALAWNHLRYVWSRDDLPLEWYLADYVEDSLPEAYMEQGITDSYNNWVTDAPCAQLSHTFVGVRQGHWAVGRSADGLNTHYFDDPGGGISGSVLAFADPTVTNEIAFSRSGVNYRYLADSDIVYGSNLDWATTQEVLDGNCPGGPAFETISTHEIGHQLGMAHSCEETDVDANNCGEQLFFDAIMFWAPNSQCNLVPLNQDDIDGISSLYGPFATFEATTETRGGTGLEVCFELNSNSAITEVEWNFGDGTFSNELEPCHVYDVQGQYTINVSIRGEAEECGEWEYTERERALVVVCDEPRPAPQFDSMFTYERLEDEDDLEAGTYVVRMINQADTTTYGCIEQAQWDIFQGDDLVATAKAWSPKMQVPGPGTYRAVLNLGGPGGVYAEDLTFTIDDPGGCSALGGSAAGLGIAFVGLLAVGFRRRD